MSGHTSPVNQTPIWLTPRHVLRALGRFNLDPCACSEPRPWPTADRHLAVEQDGLAHPWTGRVWLNPPYGHPSIVRPWLERMAEHRQGTALIFARTETDNFFEFVWRGADAALFLEGRLTFCYPDGTPADANGGAPSVLVAYGERDAQILRDCELPGAFIDLRALPPRAVIAELIG